MNTTTGTTIASPALLVAAFALLALVAFGVCRWLDARRWRREEARRLRRYAQRKSADL